MEQNLVLQTSTKTQGLDYVPYLDAIKNRLEQEGKLHITAIDGEPRWSKFLLHGVPTSATMEEVALSIQQSYPGVLKLAQTPRWLTTESSRRTSTKGMSTAVLSIAGQHTLQSLRKYHGTQEGGGQRQGEGGGDTSYISQFLRRQSIGRASGHAVLDCTSRWPTQHRLFEFRTRRRVGSQLAHTSCGEECQTPAEGGEIFHQRHRPILDGA